MSKQKNEIEDRETRRCKADEKSFALQRLVFVCFNRLQLEQFCVVFWALKEEHMFPSNIQKAFF